MRGETSTGPSVQDRDAAERHHDGFLKEGLTL